MTELDDRISKVQQDYLNELLVQCTEKQRALFDRVFPHGITSDEAMRNAVSICERTVAKNNAKSEPLVGAEKA